MNPMRALFWRRAAGLAVFLIFVAAMSPARAQVQSNSVFGQVQTAANNEANSHFTAAQLATMSQAEFENAMGNRTPVLHQMLDQPMRRFGFSFARYAWTFYQSSLWQGTVWGLLIVCAVYGLLESFVRFYHHELSGSKMAQTWITKVAVLALTLSVVAPNFPFTMTTVINSLSARMGSVAPGDMVGTHQSAFLRNALYSGIRAGEVLEPRLVNQFYADGSSLNMYGGPAPDAMVPVVNAPDGAPHHQITYAAFEFVGPPNLASMYIKTTPDGVPWLIAPPEQTDPVASWRHQISFFQNDTQTTGTGTYVDPQTNAVTTFQLRPYMSAVATALGIYQSVYNNWSALSSANRQLTTLANADKAAQDILSQAYNRLIFDIVNNQAAFNFAQAWDQLYATQNQQVGAGQAQQVNDALTRIQEHLRDHSHLISDQLARAFQSLDRDHGANSWTRDNLVPIGLFFANAYIIVGIWILPSLMSLWAVFFLLPPVFEISNALKKGAVVIIGFALYPILLHLILGFAYSLNDAGNQLNAVLDPTGAWGSSVVYAFLPNIGAGTGGAGGQLLGAGLKLASAAEAAKWLHNHDMGLVNLIVWIIILAVLVTSPAIAAKWIMGTGSAEALSQPAQQSTATGVNMVTKAGLSAGAQGMTDVSGVASALARSPSANYPTLIRN